MTAAVAAGPAQHPPTWLLHRARPTSRWRIRRRDDVQVHGAFQEVGHARHQVTPLFCGNSRLAAQPAIAEITPASEKATMGMVKLPVCCVTRPTAHIATAPAREPDPLNSPRAVETFDADTSCTIVKYIATQIPRPMFTATSTATAWLKGLRRGTTAQAASGTVASRVIATGAFAGMQLRYRASPKLRRSWIQPRPSWAGSGGCRRRSPSPAGSWRARRTGCTGTSHPSSRPR